MSPRIAPLLLVAPLLLTACGGDDDNAAPDPTATGTPSAVSPTPSLATTASPSDEGRPWATCTIERAALRVSYPEKWTVGEHAQGGCAYFDPEPFQVERQTEAPAVAIRLDVESTSYDRVRDAYLDGEVIAQREVTVAGDEGMRIEDRDTGGPLAAKGHRVTYVAELGPDKTLLLTTNETDADDFAEAQQVLDEMAERLERTT